MKKRIMNESSYGLEYIWDNLMPLCKGTGLHIIVNDVPKNRCILIYDTVGKRYLEWTDELSARASMDDEVGLDEVLEDDALWKKYTNSISDPGFKDFEIKWNNLIHSDSINVHKDKGAAQFQDKFTESTSSNEVTIRWLIDNDDAGIFEGDVEHFIVDDSVIDDEEGLINAVQKEIRDEYGIPYYYDMEEWEFVDSPAIESGVPLRDVIMAQKDREDEWDMEDGDVVYGGAPVDRRCWVCNRKFYTKDGGGCDKFNRDYCPDCAEEMDDEIVYRYSDHPERHFSESDEFDNIVEGIPNWATTYIMYNDDSGLSEEDIAQTDAFIKELERDGQRLVEPIEGSENDFNSYPAFGDACDTSDWIADRI